MQELGLYDIHCHIVPGVDDGAVNLEEAVKMVEAQYKQGIRTIIATPHFRKGMFEPSASEVKKQFQILRKTVWEINKDMRLYLGSELYASENMISQIKDKRAMPMAGSNYVLTELYEAITASQVRAYLGILISKGYRPVIAHAERYGCMRNDINFIEDMIEMGAYIQLNADSVIGKEGESERLMLISAGNSDKSTQMKFLFIIPAGYWRTHGKNERVQRKSYRIRRQICR